MIQPVLAEPAASTLEHLTEGEIVQLLDGERLRSGSEVNRELQLLLPGSLTDHHLVIADAGKELFLIEALSLLSYPSGLKITTHEKVMLSLFNTLRSVSTQEGIEYISHRRGDVPAQLISRSYIVSEVGSREPLDDPVSKVLPEEETLIVYQDDTSFRGNYYEYTYWTNDSEIAVRITNRSKMKVFGLFKAIEADEMSIYVQIRPVDEGLLIYSLAVSSDLPAEISILGYKVNLSDSFTERLIAVENWFVDRLASDSIDYRKE